MSNKCNFNCSYCFNKNKANSTTVIPEKSIIAAVEKIQPDMIDFTGAGEPLLYFSILANVITVLGNKYRYTLTTNGSLLTKSIVDTLKQNKVAVNFSYDNEHRRQFDAKEIIQEYIKEFPRSICNSVIDGSNYDFVSEIESTGKIGFHSFKLWLQRGEMKGWNSKKILDGLQKLFSFFLKKADDGDFSLFEGFLRGDGFSVPNILSVVSGERIGVCTPVGKKYSLDCDGKIYTCGPSVGCKEYELGNVKNVNDSNDKNLNFISTDMIEKCINCEQFDYCGGICKIQSSVPYLDELCKLKYDMINLAKTFCAEMPLAVRNKVQEWVDFVYKGGKPYVYRSSKLNG